MGLFDFFKKKKTLAAPAQPAAVNAPQSTASKAAAPQPSAGASGEKPYAGIYKMGVEYNMQYVPNADLHLIEVHDTMGNYLNDDPVTFMYGTIYGAVFALTEEEFALSKAAPGMSNPAVNELLDKLLTERPKDRLRMAFSINTATKERKPLAFRQQADTIDDHAYEKYRAARALAHVRSLDRVWVAYSGIFKGRYPAIDGQGYAFVFDDEAKAQENVKKNASMNLSVKSFDKQAFMNEVKSWYGLGVTRFRLNPGSSGVWGSVDRDTFAPDPKAAKWDYYGSNLKQSVLRFVQARMVANDKDFQAMAATYWNLICHNLPRTALLVPIAFDSDVDGASVEDRALHTTQEGAALLNRIALEKQLGHPIDDDKQVNISKDGKPVAIYDINLFYGSEGYSFATGQGGGAMHLRTLLGGGKTLLAAFTDLDAFNVIFHSTARVGVFTFDEIAAHLDDAVGGSDNPIDGIVLNLGTVELVLNRADIETLNKVRNEPFKIFVNKDNGAT